MQAAVASYVSSSSGTLRQGPTPVRAFAILKRTNAEYKLDTVLLPKKSNPASCRLTPNYNQARPIEPISQVLRA